MGGSRRGGVVVLTTRSARFRWERQCRLFLWTYIQTEAERPAGCMTWFTFRLFRYFRIAANDCIEEVIMTAAPGIRGDLMSGMNDKELGELRKTFDEFDLNGDGFINPEEFHALLIKLDGDVSREECLLDFDVADSEGDGYIGFKEFVVWWTN